MKVTGHMFLSEIVGIFSRLKMLVTVSKRLSFLIIFTLSFVILNTLCTVCNDSL